MGSDDYQAIGRGALKLKGAKVSKKKKKAAKSDLEKNLSAGDDSALVQKDSDDTSKRSRDKKKSPVDEDRSKDDEEDKHEDEPVVLKTESERRYEEARKKRVCINAVPLDFKPKTYGMANICTASSGCANIRVKT